MGGIWGGGVSQPGGSDSQVQYNDGGSLGGASGLVYDDVNTRVGVGQLTPLAALDVNQTAATSSVIVQDGGVDVFEIYDGGIIDLPKQSAARASCSTNQSINNATDTKVAMDTETYDIQNEMDVATNYRFTATKAGYYLIYAQTEWQSPVDQARYFIDVYKNGAAGIYSFEDASGTNAQTIVISNIASLAANDYLEVYVNQNSGAADTLQGGTGRTYWCILKVM